MDTPSFARTACAQQATARASCSPRAPRRRPTCAPLFSANNGYASTAANGLFWGLAAITIEAWVRLDSFASTLCAIAWLFTSPSGFEFYVTPTTGVLNFVYGDGTSNHFCTGPKLTPGVWTHVMGVYDGAHAYCFTNGVMGAQLAATGTTANPSAPIVFGNSTTVGNNVNAFIGAMQELRYSNVARHTANFAPPTAPYSPDAATILLLHMNEAGGTTLRDSGPNKLNAAFGAAQPRPCWTGGYF